jgi:hypothetical protein
VQVFREITLFDAGVVGVIDRWIAAEPIDVAASLTLCPRLKVDPAEQVIYDERGSAYYFLTCRLDAALEWSGIPVEVTSASYSPDYGSIAETRGLSFDLGNDTRGVYLTLFSRIGPIVPTRREGRFDIARRPEFVSVQSGGPDGFSLTLGREATCLAEQE